MSSYQAELKERLKSKQLEREEKAFQLKSMPPIDPRFMELVSNINSLSVDIKTIKSRIRYIGYCPAHLPDHNLNSHINR